MLHFPWDEKWDLLEQWDLAVGDWKLPFFHVQWPVQTVWEVKTWCGNYKRDESLKH